MATEDWSKTKSSVIESNLLAESVSKKAIGSRSLLQVVPQFAGKFKTLLNHCEFEKLTTLVSLNPEAENGVVPPMVIPA